MGQVDLSQFDLGSDAYQRALLLALVDSVNALTMSTSPSAGRMRMEYYMKPGSTSFASRLACATYGRMKIVVQNLDTQQSFWVAYSNAANNDTNPATCNSTNPSAIEIPPGFEFVDYMSFKQLWASRNTTSPSNYARIITEIA